MAWRKREERVRTLLLLYLMTHKDGPEHAQRKRNMAELIKKRAAAPVKDAAKSSRPRIIKLAEPYGDLLVQAHFSKPKEILYHQGTEAPRKTKGRGEEE